MATPVQLVGPSKQCRACSSANPAGSHYCNHCGASLDSEPPLADQIRAILKEQTKDQKILEIETSQLVVSRISEWAKLFAFFTAIPVTFLLGGLAIWGITKFTDVDDKLGKAQIRAETLQKTSTQLADQYGKLQQDLAKYQALGNEVTAVAARSDTLSAQIQSLKSDVSQIGKRVGFVPSAALTPDLQRTLQTSLASFEDYLRTLGYTPDNGKTEVAVVDKITGSSDGTVASYYPSDHTLNITSAFASQDQGNLLHEYMQVVLKERNQSWAKNQSYHAVRLGLSCYFPAAFLQRKVRGCMINESKWPATQPSTDSDINNDGSYLAGALWTARPKVPAPAFDRAAYQAWIETQGSFENNHYERVFAEALLARLSGNDKSRVTSIFSSAGLLP